MITVTFQIKPYLAAYMYVRYKNHLDVPPDRFFLLAFRHPSS